MGKTSQVNIFDEEDKIISIPESEFSFDKQSKKSEY